VLATDDDPTSPTPLPESVHDPQFASPPTPAQLAEELPTIATQTILNGGIRTKGSVVVIVGR